MNQQEIQIVDVAGRIVATAVVERRGDRLAGRAEFILMPADLRRHFEEYEQIVNGQMFSLLDEVEDRIHALRLKVEFADATAEVENLQMFPSTGRISFQVTTLVPKRPVLV